MTPTSNRPLSKVSNAAIAAAVSAIVLALIKNYLWTDMPADLEGPLDTVVVAAVVGLSSLAAGWLTRLQPGEVKPIDAAMVEQQAR